MARPIQKIACIGEVMIELIARDDSAKLSVAGDTYNTAVYLSRLLRSQGCEVSYVTALGKDGFSDRIIKQMVAHGINTDHVERRADRLPGLYAIETDAAGERSFTYWRSQSAARTLFAAGSTVTFDTLFDFDMIFLSGITLAILPPDIRVGLFDALTKFRAAGGVVAFDSNYRAALWENENTAQDCITQFWSNCDIALPSLDDEMSIFGETTEDAVVARFQTYDIDLGVMKRGGRGPRSLRSALLRQDFAQVEQVVDSTAAGDSFNAGFLAEIIKGHDFQAATTAGHELACKVIQHQGAILLDTE